MYLISLTNVYLNSFLTIHFTNYNNLLVFINLWLNLSLWFLTLFCIYIFFKKFFQKSWLLLLLFNIDYIKYINVPLSNTLFFIHPTLLIIIISFVLVIFWINFFLKNKINISIGLFLVITLGGFWAYQEFSWGGWWNWDFVEISILNFWIIWLLYSHTLIGLRSHYYMYIFLYILFLIHSCFNRWGLTTSIHRFIVSNIMLHFYQVYFFIFFMCFFFKKKKIFIGFMCLMISIFFLKEFSFLKIFVFLAVLFFFKSYNFFIRLYHVKFYLIYLVFFLFNFFNLAYLSFYPNFTLLLTFFIDDFIGLQFINPCGSQFLIFNFKLLFFKITILSFHLKVALFIMNLHTTFSGSFF